MRRRWVGLMVVTVLLSVCGGDDAFKADASIAAFVGDWRASALVLTSSFNADLSVDLIELGSSFDINIQPSGHYTAILVFAGQGQTEFGQLLLSGSSTVILDREFPTPSRDISTLLFEGPDRLILDGDTEFDFNLDGTAEPALAYFELQRR